MPLAATPVLAQAAGSPALSGSGQLLLSADSLVYDFDNELVSAVGGVQIDYQGYGLVARKVTFNQATGRLMAEGNVEIVQPDGTRIYSDLIDITDDFGEGFVETLRVETTDNTRFAAVRAERRDAGNVTVFTRGAYTACEPCADKPEKPPIWQVKAETIIWNQQRKTIRFESARFELFGFSLAGLPAFEIADHTVKRKSGFLVPRASYETDLGYSATIPYFWAIAPNVDATIEATGYTRQGLLMAGEYRHRLNSGQFSVTAAGIIQATPGAFAANTTDNVRERGMIGTKGRFEINPRWTFGWDVLVQSDKNFASRYRIQGYDQTSRASEIYLTGLGERNFFDLRAQRFEVQETATTGGQHEKEAWLLPSFDYRATPDEPVLGGELTLALNGQNIRREAADVADIRDASNALLPEKNLRGLGGHHGRLTAEAEWKRTFVLPGGLALTPLGHVRTDLRYQNYDATTNGALAAEAIQRGAALEARNAYLDTMATAGLEARWPFLFTATGSSHVLEPIAQVYVRPDSQLNGRLGIPNEDAQSLVFDASNLLDRDKFSGYDRVEGGIRANVGLRYAGTFDNGLTINALVGQSYHLAGANPFAAPDLVHVGAFSGLESNVSDVVAAASLGWADRDATYRVAASGRFDEKTFEVRRADVDVAAAGDHGTLSLGYAYIQKQPLYGFATDRHEINGNASLKFSENWTATAGATYDLTSNMMTRVSLGLAYDDECFNYALTYTETNLPSSSRKQSIGFKVSLRTLAEFGNSVTLN